MAGVDLPTVQELIGHKSIEMTLRYSHLSPHHSKRWSPWNGSFREKVPRIFTTLLFLPPPKTMQKR